MLDFEKELFELKKILLEIKDDVKAVKPILKLKISMVEFAKDLKVPRQTLYAHLKANYEFEVDFYKENNRILLNVNILQSIRGYYAK